MSGLEPEATSKKDESFDRTVATATSIPAESSFSSSEEDSIRIEEGTRGIKSKALQQRRQIRRGRSRRAVQIGIVAAALVVAAAVIVAALAATRRNEDAAAGGGYMSIPDDFRGDIPDDFPGSGSSGSGGGAGPKKQAGFDGRPTPGSGSGPVRGAPNAGAASAPQEQEQAAPPPLPPPPVYDGAPPAINCNTPPAWADAGAGWDDLTSDQRRAASYLGYTPSLWNDEEFWNGAGTGTGTASGTSTSWEAAAFEARYADLEWTDLTLDQQIAFAYLGYNAGSYSDFYNDYSFDELPPAVRAAATAVGYGRNVWDNCAAEICSGQVDNDMWQDHTRAERANLKVLGYTCWVWNNYDLVFGGGSGRRRRGRV